MTNTMNRVRKRDLVVTRTFDAPVELVWKAWVDPELVMRWWAPDGFTSPSARIDFREGGTSLVAMRAPQEFGGRDTYSTWAYTKIVPLQRIEFIHNLADQDGRPIDPAQAGLPPDFPKDMRMVVTFKAAGGKTEMSVTQYDWTEGPMLGNAETGLNQSLDKMVAIFASRGGGSMKQTKVTAVPGQLEVNITREFDAPREMVFKAFTDSKLMAQWLGPRGYKMAVEKFEPRSGGMWRYIHTDLDGRDYGFHGVFHEVAAPERIIQTFEYEGLPEKGHATLDTARFEALPDGRTRVTMQSVFQSVADRDGMIQSGMERGVNEGFEKLDELLAKRKA